MPTLSSPFIDQEHTHAFWRGSAGRDETSGRLRKRRRWKIDLRSLAEITRLPVHVLDKLQFRAGDARMAPEEYLELHRNLLLREAWIIDGYGDEAAIWKRLEAADTFIHVDLPIPVHYWRVTKRLIKGLFADPDGWQKDSPLWTTRCQATR
jgi:hypothetical protein